MASRLLPRSLRALQRPLSRFNNTIPRCAAPSIRLPVSSQTRAFSASPPSNIMDTSNFTPEQLTVRDAIAKICERFPDVLPPLQSLPSTYHYKDPMLSTRIGVLGRPRRIRRISARPARRACERWLDRHRAARGAGGCGARD